MIQLNHTRIESSRWIVNTDKEAQAIAEVSTAGGTPRIQHYRTLSPQESQAVNAFAAFRIKRKH